MRAVCVLSLIGIVASAHAAVAEVSGTVVIRFTASSTLHDFEGESGAIAWFATAAPTTGAAEPWNAAVVVPVVSLTTGNGVRDSNMMAMFEAEKHAEIVAELRDVHAEALRGADGLGVIDFDLRIRDVKRRLRANVSNWHESGNGAISFDAAFTVYLSDFGLEPPAVLFVRVADPVTVQVHVRASRHGTD